MSDVLPTQDNLLPVDLLQRIDAVACEFEREWTEGRRSRIEDFLPRLPETERPRLLWELLVVELEYRRQEPEPLALEPYRARFPDVPDIVTAAWNHVRGAAIVPAEASAASSSSSSLITRLRARDPEAWERLTRIYGPSVYGWARRAGLQHGDASDLIQEVFQAVAQHIDAFRRERRESFPAWLWTIARNKLHDWNRQRALEPPARGGTSCQQQLEQLAETPSAADVSAETQALARRALELLQSDFEEVTWQAFWRTAVDHQPAAAIAAELGLSVSSVYTAKSRVLSRLRSELIDD
jgi:RNA polymerase sigma-70 factor (ECF subfamily)